MEKRPHPLKNIKVELRPVRLPEDRTDLLIVSCTAALAALRWCTMAFGEIEGLRNPPPLWNANSELERKKDSLGSVQSIEEIAKEELGMVLKPQQRLLFGPLQINKTL